MLKGEDSKGISCSKSEMAEKLTFRHICTTTLKMKLFSRAAIATITKK